MKNKTLWINILVALMLCATAQAATITTGGDQTAGTGTLTFDQAITFNITADYTGLVFFIFDEIVTSDGSPDPCDIFDLTCSINGIVSHTIDIWSDNFAGSGSMEDISENDGIIYSVDTLFLNNGDTLTLNAGTGTMAQFKPNFNPWSSGDYNVFVTDISGNTIGAVPEPATAGLLGISAIVLFGIRRFYGRA